MVREQQLHALLYEALETEMGGIQVYRTALRCVIDEDLKQEWTEYLRQTERHERILRDLFKAMRLDPDRQTSERQVVKFIGSSLVQAMEVAIAAGKPEAAQLVATECVVLAETKDHHNWSLIGHVAEHQDFRHADALLKAYEQVEDEEDEHLYHTMGWSREMWIDALGLPAVLPPPEEEHEVKTAIGAARARRQRDNMLR